MPTLTLKLSKKRASYFYHHLKKEHPKLSKNLKVRK